MEAGTRGAGKIEPGKLLKINMRRRPSNCLQISLSFWSVTCLFVKYKQILIGLIKIIYFL